MIDPLPLAKTDSIAKLAWIADSTLSEYELPFKENTINSKQVQYFEAS